MNRFSKRMIKKYKKSKKSSVLIYLILRFLVLISIIIQILSGNVSNALLCVLALILFTLPTVLADKLRITLPSLLESMVYLFIFASAILGGINNFYKIIPIWDTILHTLNGFLCAGIGFSLVDLLNTNSKSINLSPLYVAIVAFCFSMTIGVLWEFGEFSADYILSMDFQRDRIVNRVASLKLDKKKESSTIRITDIYKTEIYSKKEGKVTIDNGYLDIGLIDTIKDLFVNLIGAVVFSIIGWLYIKNRDKYKFAANFIPRRKIDNTK